MKQRHPFYPRRIASHRVFIFLFCSLIFNFLTTSAYSETVVIQEGTGEVTGTEAAFFSTGDPGYESAALLYLRNNYPNALYFPVASNVPAGSTIDSATLEVFVYEEYNTATTNIECGYVTDPDNTGLWHDRGSGTEGSGLGATLAKKDVPSSTYWTNNENYFTTVMSSTACGQTDVQTTGWKSWDATDIVEAWQDGTYPNRGFWLREASGANSNARVRAKYHGTISQRPKLTINYTPPANPPSGTLVLNNPTAGSQSVTLSWNSVNAADGYKVRYGTASGNYTTTLDAGNITQYTVPGLANGTPYYFVVAAYNVAGDGANSNEKISTPFYAPDAVTVVIQEGTNGVTGTQAAYFSTADPNWEDASKLSFRYEIPSAVYFPVQDHIPAGSTVNSATLAVFIYEEYNTGVKNVECGYLTDPDDTGLWHDRGSGTSGSWAGATWGKKDAAVPVYWNNAQGSISAVMSSTTCGQANVQTTGWKTWDAKTVVQAWRDDAYPNRGFWLREAIGSNSNARARAKYYSTTSSRPKLTINYTPATPPPANAPTLNAPTAGPGSVDLSWSSVGDADGYKVKYGTSSGNYTTTIDVGNLTQYSVTNLTNSTPYYFIIVAYNSGGEGPASNEVSATPQSPVPAAPALNNATAGSTQVSLTWSSVTGATGYKVKYGTTSETYTSNVDVGNVTSSTVTGLINDTTYYFIVTAYNGAGESGNSNELSATPWQVTATYSSDQCTGGTSSASSCLQGCGSAYSHTKAFDDDFNASDGWVAAGVQTGWLEYQFASPKTIAKYVIHPRAQLNGNPRTWTFEAFDGNQWVVLDTRTNETWPVKVAHEYFFSNTTAYIRYRLNVSANGGHNEVGLTEMEMMEFVSAGAPLAITNLAASAGSQAVTLSWSEPDDGGSAITSYKVEYGTVAGGLFDFTHTDDAVPGATVTGLTNDTAYQFRVIAINPVGTSPVSNVVTATPLDTPLSGTISSNTVWTLADSPYRVIGDITVNSGVSLTIEAGVVVKFAGNYALMVNGTLYSLGTENQRILFSSKSATPAPGDWKYIRLGNSDNKVEYLTVEYSDRGIYVPSDISSPKNPVIRNNILRFNNNGVYFEPSTAPMIVGNTITDNTNGINAFCNTFTACNPTITWNSLTGNTGYNFFVQGGNASLIIKAENNWWGTTEENTISAGIFDHVDQPSEATVDFIPYLSSAPTDDGINITANSVSQIFNNLRTASSVDINYSIDKDADITIKIFDHATEALVRTLVDDQLRTAGSRFETWDLKNDSAQPVPAGVYVYRIDAVGVDGSLDFYGPEGPAAGQPPVMTNVSITPSSAFSPAQGDRVSLQFTLDQPALVSVGFENIMFVSDKPLNTGTNVLYWEGWGPGGLMSFYQNTVSIDAVAQSPPLTAIILDDGRTIDIPTGAADPYIIRPLYNDITTVSYSLSEAADVTVTILTPDGNTVLRTLENSIPKSAGAYQAVWDGRDSNGATIAEEGDYRVRIEAQDSFGSTATRDISIKVLF